METPQKNALSKPPLDCILRMCVNKYVLQLNKLLFNIPNLLFCCAFFPRVEEKKNKATKTVYVEIQTQTRTPKLSTQAGKKAD